jgi:AcrR family transcriptional regulator
MAGTPTTGRSNQRARTERALIDACRALMQQDRQVTMPEVARTALVSEATAYRYFPDLTTLLARSLSEDWLPAAEALAPVAASPDPVERVVAATRFLLEGVAQRQGVVRAVIASTVTRPGDVRRTRPGLRFGLIEEALRPFAGRLDAADDEQLRRALAVVVSAEALFTLTDLVGLDTSEAIDSACAAAATLTRAAFRPPRPRRPKGQRRIEPTPQKT